jgi:hypothetical protein
MTDTELNMFVEFVSGSSSNNNNILYVETSVIGFFRHLAHSRISQRNLVDYVGPDPSLSEVPSSMSTRHIMHNETTLTFTLNACLTL